MPGTKRHNLLLFSIVTIGTFLLVACINGLLYEGFKFIDVLTPQPSRQDFQLSDFYESVRFNRSFSEPASSRINIIPSDTLTREDICELLQIIKTSESKPAVIGLDLVFEERHENDPILIETIKELDNVVLPTIMDVTDTGLVYSKGCYFVQSDLEAFHHGAISFPSHSDLIRSFQPFFRVHGMVENCFAASVAALYQPDCLDALKGRDNQEEIIVFPAMDSEGISGAVHVLDDMENLPAFLKLSQGEILLIGDLHSFSDMHATPVGKQVPGVLIHAAIIDMIISHNYITSAPRWLCILVSFLFSCLATLLLIWSKKRLPNTGSLVFRLFQVVVILFLGILGTVLYVKCHYYIDNLQPILIVALSSLSFDILNGLIGVIKHLRHET